MTGVPGYPVNFDLAGASVLVIGGGHVAARKVDGLLACGARVTVVAPEAVAELQQRENVRWHKREYRRGEVASYRLAISATGVRSVDEQVSSDCQASHIPVNIADVPDLCSFTLPSVLRRGDLQITVSTNGRSPAFAGWVRRELERRIEESWAAALELVASVRDEIHAEGTTTEIPGWHESFDEVVELVAGGETEAARRVLRISLGADALA